MTSEERELTIVYLEEMKEKYIEGEGYERHPLPEYYALDMAIRSLEAWEKVFHEANERYITFIPSNFEEGETYEGAFHDGMGYVMDVIDKHLKEVEE